MKIKNLLVLGIASSAMFIFSGCSGKSGALVANEKSCQVAKYKNAYCSQQNVDTYIVDALGESSTFVHTNLNNSVRASLQVSAELALQKDMKYFAIIEPQSVSNVNGSMVTSVKEFLDKCEFAMLENYTTSKCDIHRIPRRTMLMIKLYKEQPKDILTFNAQNVLNDLKELGYYQSDSKLEASEIKEIK
ncbi:hypothetical protein [Aliarcobacter cryaerophilus]|uniref:hypothetical protein n=1 Tax=Aliarcobacter cryaerophilus TaxID=28198 RepID=UPI0021B556DA|nr:hypothetical protein [Aliarcobacter cryaerophilus]MCT7472626.1 hypothetical protein [Aliarcobacter cryaerophilus]